MDSEDETGITLDAVVKPLLCVDLLVITKEKQGKETVDWPNDTAVVVRSSA